MVRRRTDRENEGEREKERDGETSASGRKCSEANVHSQAATAALSSLLSFSFSSISTPRPFSCSRPSSSSHTKVLSSALLHLRRRRRRCRRRQRRRLLVVDDHDDDDGDVQQREQNVPTPPTPPPPCINLLSLLSLSFPPSPFLPRATDRHSLSISFSLFLFLSFSSTPTIEPPTYPTGGCTSNTRNAYNTHCSCQFPHPRPVPE